MRKYSDVNRSFALLIIVSLIFFAWTKTTYMYGVAFPISVEKFYNMSKVNIVDDSTFTSVGGIDTTAFPLSAAGTGQLWVINRDKYDTLLVSFDDGDNWLEILTDHSSAVFSPANYDSIHFLVHAFAGSDSTVTPTILWTSYDKTH